MSPSCVSLLTLIERQLWTCLGEDCIRRDAQMQVGGLTESGLDLFETAMVGLRGAHCNRPVASPYRKQGTTAVQFAANLVFVFGAPHRQRQIEPDVPVAGA
jgi:hypothetical protein